MLAWQRTGTTHQKEDALKAAALGAKRRSRPDLAAWLVVLVVQGLDGSLTALLGPWYKQAAPRVPARAFYRTN